MILNNIYIFFCILFLLKLSFERETIAKISCATALKLLFYKLIFSACIYSLQFLNKWSSNRDYFSKYSQIFEFLNGWLLQNERAAKRHFAIYSRDEEEKEPLLNSSVRTYKYRHVDLWWNIAMLDTGIPILRTTSN